MNENRIILADEAMRSGGIFTVTHLSATGEVLSVDTDHNLVTTEGLTEIGNRVFGTQVQTPWYVALYTGAHTPLASDTGATFASLATEYTAYNETTRQLFNSTNSNGLIVNTANKATFTFAENVTIRGIGVLSVSTKGATFGILLSENLLLSAKTFASGEQLMVEYQFLFQAS